MIIIAAIPPPTQTSGRAVSGGAVFQQQIAHLHPFRQILLHADHSGVGDRPSGEFTKSGSSNHALTLPATYSPLKGSRSSASPLGHAALLHQQLQTEQQIEIKVVMDFFMSGNGASRRDEHNHNRLTMLQAIRIPISIFHAPNQPPLPAKSTVTNRKPAQYLGRAGYARA